MEQIHHDKRNATLKPEQKVDKTSTKLQELPKVNLFIPFYTNSFFYKCSRKTAEKLGFFKLWLEFLKSQLDFC